MTTATKTVQAREAIGICVGARPPVYATVIVRDRATRQLVEVPLTELEPVDPRDEGRFYVFSRGEKVAADHEAVLDCPGAFAPIDD